MRRPWCAALVLGLIVCASQAVAQTALPLRTVGRTVPGEGGFSLMQWPGVYFEGAFTGAEVTVGPVSGKARFKVEIDGAQAGLLASGDPALRISGLSQAAHQLRVERIDEQRDVVAGFGGATVPGAENVLAPPPPRARQIEFIGDSFTTGFGLTAGRSFCTNGKIWATTDTSQTFAARLGRHYDADYQVIAYSAGGLVRNSPFRRTKPVVPQLYERTLFDDPTPAPRDPTWRPQLLVLSLGSNDFAPMDRREAWKTPAQVEAALVPAAVAFVRKLQDRYPGVKILLLDFDEAPVVASNRLIMAELEKAGVSDVRHVSTRDRFAFSGCFQHLDAADNARITTQLQEVIDAWPGVWSR